MSPLFPLYPIQSSLRILPFLTTNRFFTLQNDSLSDTSVPTGFLQSSDGAVNTKDLNCTLDLFGYDRKEQTSDLHEITPGKINPSSARFTSTP